MNLPKDVALSDPRIMERYWAAWDRLLHKNLRRFPAMDAELLLISDAYPGVWLEHTFDAVCLATMNPAHREVARAQTLIFLQNQKPDGQLPCYVLDASHPSAVNYGRTVGYGQLQECVSFARLCWETYLLLRDREYLETAYRGCARWDDWLRRHRDTQGTGLIELFCEFDTGHDHSPRLAGISARSCPGGDAGACSPEDFMPLLAPDLNAVVYGSRCALEAMAAELGLPAEAAVWRRRAEDLRETLLRRCYDEADGFFYDVDRQGRARKYRTIHIASLFSERVLEPPLADAIYHRYLRNPAEFWTAYPFPAMSLADPRRSPGLKGNDWGYYSQGLTALRTLRWMEHYGYAADARLLMEAWVKALAVAERPFAQELDPVTGAPSECSPWYSSAMLFYIAAVRTLGLAGGE